MEPIELKVIATVSNDRDHLHDDDWGDVVSEIILNEDQPAALLTGLVDFSHVEVIFIFDRKAESSQKIPPTRHPRN